MRFLEDFKLLHERQKNITLLDVQAAVFEHFEDLRRSVKLSSTVAWVNSEDEPSTNACICRMIPRETITHDELVRYRSLLTAAAHGSLNHTQKSGKRRKKNEVDELKALHSRVTKAQIAIQQQLSECPPCSHPILPPSCESSLLEYLSTCRNAYPNIGLKCAYELIETITSLNEANASIYLRSSHAPVIHKFVVPVVGQNRLVNSDELKRHLKSLAAQGIPFNSEPHPPHTGTHPVVDIPESIFVMLFTQLSLSGIRIPFDVTEVPGDSKDSGKQLKFDQPIWFSLPDARMRARQFYTFAAQFYFWDKQLYTSTGQLCDDEKTLVLTAQSKRSVSSPNAIKQRMPAEPAIRKSARIRARNEMNSLRNALPDKSEGERFERLTPEISNTSSKQLRPKNSILAPPVRRSDRLNSSMQTKSSNFNQKLMTSKSEGSEEENEETEGLSIDVGWDPDPNNSTLDLDKLHEQIRSICTVVSRTTSNNHPNEFSRTVSPVCDAPRSPESTMECDSNTIEPNDGKTTEPRVIPLEPLQHSFTSSPLPSSVSHVSDPVTQHPACILESSNPTSTAILELNGKIILIRYINTAWSPDDSCSACRSTVKRGQCPVWPHCDSMKAHWEANEKKWGKLQPMFMQIKPEYLSDWGCEVLSSYESAEAWLGSTIRNGVDIVRVRVRVDSGELVWVEYQTLADLLASTPTLRPESQMGIVSTLLDKLVSLKPGSYLLSQNESNSYQLYRAVSGQQSDDDPRSPKLRIPDAFKHFDRLASELTNFLTSRNILDEDGTGKVISPSLLTVSCAMLDLDLPAGLESEVQDQSGQVLRLPALPLSRLWSSDLKTSPFSVEQSHSNELEPPLLPTSSLPSSPQASGSVNSKKQRKRPGCRRARMKKSTN